MATSQARKLALVAKAIYETVQECGGAPSGHLYAAVMSHCTLDEYQTVIDFLVEHRFLIRDGNHWLSLGKEKA